MDALYPAGPAQVPADLTQPSAVYKRRAWLAVASLGFFVGLYFALAGWFCWTAWKRFQDMVASSGEAAVLDLAIGTAAAFLALFMLKALFFVKRGGASDDIELKPSEQPRLFEFLHRLADEAGAPRPAKVYISARVNACVFYDLSILNLLFPSRKNLEIGLALVNVLSLSEMKAVLAHEFGHFAQRSMAIGSWIYIAQQIAGHVIAKRDALDRLLKFISGIDIRIAWVGWGLQLIVWSIRSLLDSVFRMVILAQRALSRQMEFQADLVAVSLTGSDELVHALHKLQAADEAWGRALNFADAELRQGRIVHDLFEVQSRIIDKMAVILDDPSYGQVPAAGAQPVQHRVFKTRFAQPPQMWSTHPANADREENAKRHYMPAPHDSRSAWLLFDQVETVKQAVVAAFFREAKAEAASAEQTQTALDQHYALLRYQPEYRGAYLGRSLCRHVAEPTALYEESLQQADVQQALAALYPASLAGELRQLDELEEELGTLKALRDKVYQATGGQIVFRGRVIARRELPAAIRRVTEETEAVRGRILEHDRSCRSAHLAAAAQLGQGWRDYLIGLIRVLHYAEHSLADVRDAHGLLGNVVAIVTADGKVSAAELKRLLGAANQLQGVLARIHAQRDSLRLDTALLARLNAESWTAMLGDFQLPPATNDNINNWMQVIDGWVHGLANPLSTLVGATLEQLLLTEADIVRWLREQQQPATAPEPGTTPEAYHTLLIGKERERQKKLDWWSRFQTADGALAGGARLLVAGGVVGAVLGFGGSTGLTSQVTVYNGLGTPVNVSVAGQEARLGPYDHTSFEVEFSESPVIEARQAKNVIEHFTPELQSGHGHHYIYNVAGASPLVEWTAAYGNVQEEKPRMLGAPRWTTSDADVYFEAPPESISTKSGSGTRDVLIGLGNREPVEQMQAVNNEAERRQVILAHARWDEDNIPATAGWKEMAKQVQASAN